MKRVMLLIACAFPLLGYSSEATTDESSAAPSQAVRTKEIALKMDPFSEEQNKAGLSGDAVRQLVVKLLADSGISVSDTVTQPCLVLRIRTIPVGLDTATFFQMSLTEEAMLVRTRSIFMAPTWSQASILSCRPEDLQKEVTEMVTMMTQSFAKDFARSFQS